MPTRSVPAASATTTNEFALALYSLLRRTPGNLFFSPLSLRVALGMALAGARGDTATEMSTALGMSATDESSHADLANVVRRLQGDGQSHEIAVANALWGRTVRHSRPASWISSIGTMTAVSMSSIFSATLTAYASS
jgi:serine protease inhibitor